MAISKGRSLFSLAVFVAVALCLLFVSGPPVLAKEVAGKVLISVGKNQIIRADGTVDKAKIRAKIFSGDTIKTGAKGRLHIRFTDRGVLSLKADTDFRIDDYVFEPKESGNGKANYSLIKGGMRKLTGLIGKKDRSNYQVNTTVATIGIRGTSYRAALLTSGSGTSKNSAPPGLYLGVDKGAVSIANATGEQVLQPGEYGYTASRNSVIEVGIEPHQILQDAATEESGTEEEESETSEEASDEGEEGSDSEESGTEEQDESDAGDEDASNEGEENGESEKSDDANDENAGSNGKSDTEGELAEADKDDGSADATSSADNDESESKDNKSRNGSANAGKRVSGERNAAASSDKENTANSDSTVNTDSQSENDSAGDGSANNPGVKSGSPDTDSTVIQNSAGTGVSGGSENLMAAVSANTTTTSSKASVQPVESVVTPTPTSSFVAEQKPAPGLEQDSDLSSQDTPTPELAVANVSDFGAQQIETGLRQKVAASALKDVAQGVITKPQDLVAKSETPAQSGDQVTELDNAVSNFVQEVIDTSGTEGLDNLSPGDGQSLVIDGETVLAADSGNISGTGGTDDNSGNTDSSTGGTDDNSGNTDSSTGGTDDNSGNTGSGTGGTDDNSGNTGSGTGGTDDNSGNTDSSTGGTDDNSGNTDSSTGGTDDNSGNTDSSTGGTGDNSGNTDNSTGGTDDNSGNTDSSTGGPDDNSGNTDSSTGGTDDDSGNTDSSTGGTDDDSGNTDGTTGGPGDNSGNTDDTTGGTDDNSGNTDGTTGGTDDNSGNTDGTTDGTDDNSGNTDGTTGGTDDNSGNADGTTGGTDDNTGNTDSNGNTGNSGDSSSSGSSGSSSGTGGSGSSGSSSGSTGGTNPPPPPPPPPTPPPQTVTSTAANNTGVLVGFIQNAGGSPSGETAGWTVNGSDETLTLATTPNGTANTIYSGASTDNAFSFNASTAADNNEIVQAGSLTETGKTVHWGKWINNWQVDVDGVPTTPAGALHFIYSPDLTTTAQLATKATTENRNVLYRLESSSGTVPSDEAGNVVGQYIDGSAVFNFPSGGSVSLKDINLGFVRDGDPNTLLVFDEANAGELLDLTTTLQSTGLVGVMDTICPPNVSCQQSGPIAFNGGLDYAFVGATGDRFIGSYVLAEATDGTSDFATAAGTLIFNQVPDNTANYQLIFPDSTQGGYTNMALMAGDAQASVTDTASSAFDLLGADHVGYYYQLNTAGGAVSFTQSDTNTTTSSDRISWGGWGRNIWSSQVDGAAGESGNTGSLFFTAADHTQPLASLPAAGRLIYRPPTLGEMLLINGNEELMSVDDHFIVINYGAGLPRIDDYKLKFTSSNGSYQFALADSTVAPTTGYTWNIALTDTTGRSGSTDLQFSGDSAQRALATFLLNGDSVDGSIYGVSGYQSEAVTEAPLAAGIPVYLGFIVDDSGPVSYLLSADTSSGDSFNTESLYKSITSGSVTNGEARNADSSASVCQSPGCNLNIQPNGFVVESVVDDSRELYYGRIDGDWAVDLDGTAQTRLGELHYIYSTDLTTPTELASRQGIRLYKVTGGTNPTDQAGNVGVVPGAGAAAIDFDYNKLLGMDFEQHIGADKWRIESTAGSSMYADADTQHHTSLNGDCLGCSPSISHTGSLSYSFTGANADQIIAGYESGNKAATSAQTGTLIFEPVATNSNSYQFVVPEVTTPPSIKQVTSGDGQVITQMSMLAPLFTAFDDGANPDVLIQTQSANSFFLQTLGSMGSGNYVEWGYWNQDWEYFSADAITTGTKPLMYSAAESALDVTQLSALTGLGQIRYSPKTFSDVHIFNLNGEPAMVTENYIDVDMAAQQITDFKMDLIIGTGPRAYTYLIDGVQPVALSSVFTAATKTFDLNIKNDTGAYVGGLASLRFAGAQANHLLASYLLPADPDALTDNGWLYGTGGYQTNMQASGLANVAFLSSSDAGSTWTGSSVPLDSTADANFMLQTVGGVGNVPVSGNTTNTDWNNAPGDFNVDSSAATLSSDGGLAVGGLAMNWGYWSSAGLVLNENSGTVSTGGFHYVYSPDIVDPASMTASGVIRYVLDGSSGGGTAPTDQTGTAGTLNNVQMLVDYHRTEIVGLDMNLSHSGFNWNAFYQGGPVSLNSAGNSLHIDLNAYRVDLPGTTLNGSATIGFIGANGELASGSYELLKPSNDFGLTGAFGLEPQSMMTLSDVYYVPVALDAATDSIELLNLQGRQGYIPVHPDYQLPSFVDIDGYCGGGGSEECRLLTINGTAQVDPNSIPNLTWGYWDTAAWSINSTEVGAAPQAGSRLPFITSPVVDIFDAGKALRGLMYSADGLAIQLEGVTESDAKSLLALDFASMRIMHADIGFTDTGSTIQYQYETSAPVALAGTEKSISLGLTRSDGGNGSGTMLFSLVDTAQDDSMVNAMSTFKLNDTDNTKEFFGTAAYQKDAEQIPNTAASGLQVLLATQSGSADTKTIAAINSDSRVTMDTQSTPNPQMITTGHSDTSSCSDCMVFAGDTETGSTGNDSGLDVSWGRWADDATEGSFGGSDIALEQLHYIHSTNRTPDVDITTLSGSSAGTITYGLIGGSAPTNNAGVVGSYNGASMGVDFGTQQIMSTDIDMTIGADNVILQQSGGPVGISGVLSGGTIPMESATGSTVSGLAGDARAVFIGPAATPVGGINVPPGIMSTFGAGNGTDSVSGAVLLGNPATSPP